MTFHSDEEYGEFIRRAMRAEADSVVPSPEGLDIVRSRIANKRMGLRGIFWWRIGVSVAAAALVSGTVVMLVPELRDQVAQTTGIGISPVNDDNGLGGDTSSVNRPPVAPSLSLTTNAPTLNEPTSATTPRVESTARPLAATPSPCPTPEPTSGVVEPDAKASRCPDDTPFPDSTPTTPSISPTPSPSGCSGDQCSPASESPSPTPSDTVTPNSAETPAE